jgi:hypothetical protein
MSKPAAETTEVNARAVASGVPASEDADSATGLGIGDELVDVSGGLPDLDAGGHS